MNRILRLSTQMRESRIKDFMGEPEPSRYVGVAKCVVKRACVKDERKLERE